MSKYKAHIKRVLTSGGAPTALEGVETLKKLVELSRELEGPKILVGSGVNPDNLANLHETIGASEYHFGSGCRKNGDFSQPIDEVKMAKISSILKN